MSTVVMVSGLKLQAIKQVNVCRSLDNISAECQLVTSADPDSYGYIHLGDQIQVYLDGVSKIYGYADKFTDSESGDTHTITWTIRDSVADLIDSTCPASMKFITAKTSTLQQFILAAVNAIGIVGMDVIDQNGYTFPAELTKAAKTGQKMGDYLNDVCRLKGAIMSTDGQGNVILYNLGAVLQFTMLVNQYNGTQNNILESTLEIDNSARFYKYSFHSSGPIDVGDEGYWYTYQDHIGQALDIDQAIRSTRVMELNADITPTSNDINNQLTLRAQQESNLRRARAVNYTCKVSGYSGAQQPWDIGQLVKLRDEKRNCYGLFMIKEVTNELSDAGESTTLKLTWPDAYGIQATLTDPNTVSISRTYNQTPTNWKRVRVQKGQQIKQTNSGIKK